MNLLWCPFNRIIPKKLIFRFYLLLNHNIKSLKKMGMKDQKEGREETRTEERGRRGGEEKRVTFFSFLSHPKT